MVGRAPTTLVAWGSHGEEHLDVALVERPQKNTGVFDRIYNSAPFCPNSGGNLVFVDGPHPFFTQDPNGPVCEVLTAP